MWRLLVLVGAALAAAPSAAHAHGLSPRADLPIPEWLFTWGAAVVLIVSFVALAVLWQSPRLQDPSTRALPDALGRVLTSRPLEVVCGAIGVGLLVLVVYAGYAGTDNITLNFAPTFVFVAFWVGLVLVSVLFGDLFRLFNPWRAVGRVVGWACGRASSATEPLQYPVWLGYWPAAVGLAAFAWLELVATTGSQPDSVATATLIYSAATWVGMSLYGVETWARRGEAFSVYFGLFARLSPFVRDGRQILLRTPLSGVTSWPTHPGTVALLAVMIGTVSFDGFSAGEVFNGAADDLVNFLQGDLGFPSALTIQLIFGTAMVLAVVIIGGVYWLGVSGARTADRSRRTLDLARSFAHTLVPIALAYVLAHYVSLFIFQSQALGYLASDPLGDGADLFGTADWAIDYGVVGAELFWYLQVGFVVLGHVAALALAHDRALVAFPTARAAVRSQYYLLVVMIGFTSLALWLLAQAREG
jgi:hypothetical protein